uniref:Transporter n=1 Tax=Desulfobacca acetoxidans TaxID=60893 RepID=A0A7C3V9X1_9BACT
MRKLLWSFICFSLLFGQTWVWAQEKETPTVGEERRQEQRQAQAATRVAEVERGGALMPAGRFVIEPSFEYDAISGTNVSISGFTIFQAILIGRVQIQKLKRDLFIPALTFRAGMKNAELYVRIPYFFRTDKLVFPVSGGSTTNIDEKSISDNGLGDITTYIYYHAIREGQWKPWVPDTVVRLGMSFPTGKDPYHLSRQFIPSLGAILPVEFPTGTGHFGLVLGSTFVKSVDPAVIFANVAYYFNFGRHIGTVDNIDYGNIKLGNTFEYNIGIILSLQERLSMNFSLNQRLTSSTLKNGNSLPDSSLNAISLNIGATYVIPPRMAVDFVVGIGLTEDAPDVSVLVRLPILFKFGRK